MADLRAADLMKALLNDTDGWLQTDSELDTLLPTDSQIVPAGIAQRLWSSNTSDPSADVVVAVGVVPTLSTRNNRRVEKDFEVSVDVAATDEWIENDGEGSILDLQEIHDRVQQLLDLHRDEWTADGIAGGTEGVVPDDERNRYAGVVLAGVSRTDDHDAYQ